MTVELATTWEVRDISKAFPGVQALDQVSLTLMAGEIHALVGENGSGKSTLVKCLAGVHQPDSGEIRLGGETITMPNPIAARQRGVATIYQELSLVPTLTVAENIFLGRFPTMMGHLIVDWETMRRESVRTLKALGIEIDPDAVVKSLSMAEQQLIEIAKAISEDSSLLAMDEPTAALGLSETRRLQDLIRQLARQGKAILYISHRIDEVFQIADRISVLKDGRLAGSSPVRELSVDAVVKQMLGTEVTEHYPKQHHSQERLCLEVEGLRTESGVRGASFSVHAGEVLGLGGMVGSGRTEIARALFGLDRPTGGAIRLDGRAVRFDSPEQAIANGVALVPENRKADGLFMNFRGPENITIANLAALLYGPFLDLGREARHSKEFFGKLNISQTGMDRTVQFLSGGNQQKVILARWLFSKARLLILDEPTQGVDVGARIEVYHIINELTALGIAILLISSDYPELLAMSDRIAIVRNKQILQILPSSQLTEYRLLELASRSRHPSEGRRHET
ncbi:MAG TPA: sugar ABC transporter ATP-binding protein [Anaerolineales bacterium]|nr:sugar ABC transporter ATP-binding protein [Anaerolineales bacterium]